MPSNYLLAALGAAALATVSASSPESGRAARPYADPLFGASLCTAAQPGRPPLLERLVLAQAQTRPETAPFKPGQQLPAASTAAMPPLYDNLGALHVPVSTANPKAQAYFNQGMRLTFSFNHAEAARAFRAAQSFDANCAMCHWGEALVLGPNINAPMFPDAAAPAAKAADRALALAGKATPTEQALICAVAKRYAANPPADRKPLDAAYADAMAEAARSASLRTAVTAARRRVERAVGIHGAGRTNIRVEPSTLRVCEEFPDGCVASSRRTSVLSSTRRRIAGPLALGFFSHTLR